MQKISILSTSILLLTSSLFASSLSEKPTSSSLIVYNGGIGLVHEERKLNIKKGDKQIIYKGVASTIETDSVNVALPDSVTLYSQQYRFDKLTMNKLLDAHIGEVVKVAKESVTLLSHSGANALVRDASNEIISVLSKDIIFKNIPDSLLTKPSLVWNIDAKKSIDAKMDIDYLIKNLSWKSDYILNLRGDKANLTGWITIDNRSGKAYKNTKLHVLAGDINRAQRPKPRYKYERTMAMQSAPAVAHQAHEGYHFYTIPFKVNLSNNEKTQIKFITQNTIPIKRRYTASASNPLYLHGEKKHSVTQFIEIKKLDFVLPKGVVRTYSKLNKSNILLGETSISHTPKDTPIKLTLGKNFDLKVKETIKKRSDTKSYLSATVLYTLKNSSDEKKTLELLVPFNKNTTSTIETSKKYKFKHGNKLSFKVVLDAKKTETFQVSFRSKR
ncbi:MAG: hypothetical protein COB99_03645 [Sulfurimonas sp.]|nr:MAG: hypothetical protein COB99_03645 [Sulfurimonas sp.]